VATLLRALQPYGLALSCACLAACAAAPPVPKAATVPPAPPALPVMIASPVDSIAVTGLEARLPETVDSQALLRFKVTTDGNVADASVVMSSLPADTQASLLAAFSGLHFKPYMDHGKPVRREFIYPLFFGPHAQTEATRFFCLHQQERYAPADRCDIVSSGAWRVYRVTLPYPQDLLGSGVSGEVSLGFDIGADGVPHNAKVLKSSPSGVFESLALASLQRWYFEPQGDATDTTTSLHGTVTVNFTPPVAGNPAALKPSVPPTGRP
jgi:TonB family protein